MGNQNWSFKIFGEYSHSRTGFSKSLTKMNKHSFSLKISDPLFVLLNAMQSHDDRSWKKARQVLLFFQSTNVLASTIKCWFIAHKYKNDFDLFRIQILSDILNVQAFIIETGLGQN